MGAHKAACDPFCIVFNPFLFVDLLDKSSTMQKQFLVSSAYTSLSVAHYLRYWTMPQGLKIAPAPAEHAVVAESGGEVTTGDGLGEADLFAPVSCPRNYPSANPFAC